jgi:hypothetical protein
MELIYTSATLFLPIMSCHYFTIVYMKTKQKDCTETHGEDDNAQTHRRPAPGEPTPKDHFSHFNCTSFLLSLSGTHLMLQLAPRNAPRHSPLNDTCPYSSPTKRDMLRHPCNVNNKQPTKCVKQLASHPSAVMPPNMLAPSFQQ